jgi:hypothetical protein
VTSSLFLSHHKLRQTVFSFKQLNLLHLVAANTESSGKEMRANVCRLLSCAKLFLHANIDLALSQIS